MIKIGYSLILLTFIGSLLMSCSGGTGVGNPPNVGFVNISFKTSVVNNPLLKQSGASKLPDSIVVMDKSGNPFTFLNIQMLVRRFDIRKPDTNECENDTPNCTEERNRINGPFFVDLLKEETEPIIQEVELPVGIYNELEIKVDVGDSLETEPNGFELMDGHSMVLQGIFEYSGRSDRNFTILLEFSSELKYTMADSIQLVENETRNWNIEFNVYEWLANLEVIKCIEDNEVSLDVNGDLTIDNDTSCSNLEESLEDNIKASGKLNDDSE